MLNVIFTTLPVQFNDTPDAPSKLRQEFNAISEWVTPVPEAQVVNGRIMVQGICSEDNLPIIEKTLTDLNLAPKIVWVGDTKTGLQYGKTISSDPATGAQTITGTPIYPFDSTEYNTFLLPNLAPLSQINKFAGMPDRDFS